jgi:hypothetical protein
MLRSTEKRRSMPVGPVQLIVLGFAHPEFHGQIIAELERLKASDTVRVIDALAVYKDAAGTSKSSISATSHRTRRSIVGPTRSVTLIAPAVLTVEPVVRRAPVTASR